MFRLHYDGWRKSRMDGVNKYVKADYFNGKTLLECGAGFGFIAKEFQEKGADATICDARAEHLQFANEYFPELKSFVFNAEKDSLTDSYNVVVHWGLLYHLNKDCLETHLQNIHDHCDVMLLETEVLDTEEETVLDQGEDGYDQAFSGVGCRPSQTYVESLLRKVGFEFSLIKDSILNSEFHTYDWEPENDSQWKSGKRRFWICWKPSVESPLV